MAETPKVIVLGAGVCGLAAATMLARDGHEVLVLERDSAPVPDSTAEAWESWERDGVVQFNQAHYLHPRTREVLDEALPDASDALRAAGAITLHPGRRLPAGIDDKSLRAGDERLTALTARRPTLEFVVARLTEQQPGLEVRRGVRVTELLTRAFDGVPHVTGVRTDSGDHLEADLVIDAMGRSSPLPSWLEGAGAAPAHEEAEDSGFIYYSRFYRSANGGGVPELRAPILTPIGTFSVLTIPADNDFWSVTVYIASGDQPLKAVRHPDVFTTLIAACPAHAHWLEGEPVTDLFAMGGVLDRHRRYVVDGEPVVTGIVPLGDAYACTNPSLGRGISLGLAQALLLRDTARAHLGDAPRAFALAYDERSQREIVPWYRATVSEDRRRLAEIHALREGREPAAPTDWAGAVAAGLPIAMSRDPDIFRAGLEIISCLTLPQEVFARPGLAERVLELAEEHRDERRPLGPDRAGLLDLVSGARSAARS